MSARDGAVGEHEPRGRVGTDLYHTVERYFGGRSPLGRRVFFAQAKKRTLAKTHGNYPAAERILEVVRLGLSRGMQAGLGAEAVAFGELAASADLDWRTGSLAMSATITGLFDVGGTSVTVSASRPAAPRKVIFMTRS